jgi:GPH family glycoside/pentoside/hexuronide:cation symporter
MTEILPLSKRLAYAAPAFALAIVGIPVYVYIPKFYTDVVGVNIAALGTLLLLVRVFDAVTDPLIGSLSDRTTTRFGRRRPYIAGGSILLAITMYALFNPPVLSSSTAALWFGVSIFAVFLFWTVVTVPYESLGPELSFDYNHRTVLFAYRDGALLVGTLVAASSPALVASLFDLSADGAGERAKFFWVSVFYVPLMVLLCWWSILALRERNRSTAQREEKTKLDLRLVARNRPFIILLIAYTISALGSSLPATLILYYVEYVLLSSKADLFLALYFVTGILLLPAWIRIAHRIGKKRAWLLSMAINTGAFIGVYFLGPGDTTWYAILVVLSGLGFGATVALPSAMEADVIDYDELLSGRRREGLYVGIWSITKKLTAALGVGLALAVLGASGYVPNVQQSQSVQLTLRILYALVPSLCNIVAFVIALAYPIDANLHGRIRAAIRERKEGRPAEDPVERERFSGRAIETTRTGGSSA